MRDPTKSWAQTDPCGPCGPKGLEEVITGEELRLTEPMGPDAFLAMSPATWGRGPALGSSHRGVVGRLHRALLRSAR